MFLKVGWVGVVTCLCLVPSVLSAFGEGKGLQNLLNIPTCPPKVIRDYDHPYVIYGEDPAQCYEASTQGPCPHGSALFAQPSSVFGVCSCECFLGDGEPAIFDVLQGDRYRYCFSSRLSAVFVYDRESSSCHQLGSQGPCPSGKILHKNVYEIEPKCVGNKTREDISNTPHTPIAERGCPPGTIFSELLNTCTDMNFKGGRFSMMPGGGWSRIQSTTQAPGKCPEGTIYSTLLNKCTDMNFKGGKFPAMGWGSGSSSANSGGSSSKCPPGTIYSTLLNKCTDMNFKGGRFPAMGWGSNMGGSSSSSTTGKCPPGTIYSTLLNKCTDMNFHGGRYPAMGWGSSSSGTEKPGKCPEGTIYSTLLNICTDMNFQGQTTSASQTETTTNVAESGNCNKTTTPAPTKIKAGECPPGTIVSTLLNKCVTPAFKGLKDKPVS